MNLLILTLAAAGLLTDDQPLELPRVGDHQLRIISPDTLELTLITTKEPDPAPITTWNFAAKIPAASEFQVSVGGKQVPVKSVGFKRRVLYAPLRERDLRIGNYLYLVLGERMRDGQAVDVKSKHWSAAMDFKAACDPLRFGPAIHVNQAGYIPSESKKAMVGYYLGSLRELKVASDFKLVDATNGKEVFSGRLTPRPDKGFTFPCYQQVLEADFTTFKMPGEYRLQVPGLGASWPFWIQDGVAAALARAHALGLYHQRCGAANAMPFTRFTHGPCHTAAAEVPDSLDSPAQKWIAQSTADYTNTPRHTAPQLKDTRSSLYPFVRKGKIDVSGGHHDAGDYSKYTINSAGLIHYLMIAADTFDGAGELDNLGLPESGDRIGDILQIAKWEADFLAKMQDDDGGFYFLVYPKERRYENNVTPDKGDPQIVWPKNTAATAAAVAALAECASSPLLKKHFPKEAGIYSQKAKKGWAFLDKAIAKYGKDGAYQKLTHYGNEFLHDDELAWAACEMFLATGDQVIHKRLTDWFNPNDPNTRRWGWQRLCGSYGCAIRSYALAPKSGRIKADQLDVGFLKRAENELVAAAEDHWRRAQESAYGTSFPTETKRVRAAGWYFSSEAAFDLAAACQLDFPTGSDPRAKFREALLSNINYELGCNPVNVSYTTGLGWKWQREIVHQYALNDRRTLPPSGIPIGNMQSGFMWLDLYKKELGALSFPSDGEQANPYPFYDRWGDSYNLSQEFVVLNPARDLGAAAWLMAQTSMKSQPWKPATPAVVQVGNPKATVSAPGIDLGHSRIIWEAEGMEPHIGPALELKGTPAWIEVEIVPPDGRRMFGVRGPAE
ncbi:MAG TPA: glycoside hydrolase family 9 protein [Verrucomicrobiae bacterium]|nr:glycoside hydrolase family 9 protein [Verrucomicrobiae bacterium]